MSIFKRIKAGKEPIRGWDRDGGLSLIESLRLARPLGVGTTKGSREVLFGDADFRRIRKRRHMFL